MIDKHSKTALLFILTSIFILKNANSNDLNESMAIRPMESQWIETPFWKAPKIAHAKVKIEVSDLNSLKRECLNFYQKLSMMSLSGDESYRDFFIKNNRTYLNGNPFEILFKIPMVELSVEGRPLQGLQEVKPKLPHYIFLESDTIFNYSRNHGVKYKVIDDSSDRLTSHREKLLLLDNEQDLILIGSNDFKYALEVRSRDLACDIINQKIEIESVVETTTYLNKKDQSVLLMFYNGGLQVVLNQLVQTSTYNRQNLRNKSALLGFHLGKYLDENLTGHKDENISSYLMNIFSVLFDEKTLSPTKFMSYDPLKNRYEILFNSSFKTEALVTLSL